MSSITQTSSAPSSGALVAAAPAMGVQGGPVMGDLLRGPLVHVFAFSAVAFVAVFFRWFHTQHLHSSENFQDWGHSYVIPLISGFLVWRHRAVFRAVPIEPFWAGLAPALLGLTSYLFCVVALHNHMMQGFSIILTLFGLCLTWFGPGAMRYLTLPIGYLVFAVTISERIMIEITFKLQLIAAFGGWVLLSMIGAVWGFSVELAGNTLTLIDSKGTSHGLDVAEACSGMRMVVAFFATAGAVALISCKHWWQRIALMLLAAPVAIFINMFRVAILGILSVKVDPGLATGDAHMVIGTLLLVPGLGLFLAINWALSKVIVDDGKKVAA